MFLMVKKAKQNEQNKNHKTQTKLTHRRELWVVLPKVHITWLAQFLQNYLVCSSENEKFELLFWEASFSQLDIKPTDF